MDIWKVSWNKVFQGNDKMSRNYKGLAAVEWVLKKL